MLIGNWYWAGVTDDNWARAYCSNAKVFGRDPWRGVVWGERGWGVGWGRKGGRVNGIDRSDVMKVWGSLCGNVYVLCWVEGYELCASRSVFILGIKCLCTHGYKVSHTHPIPIHTMYMLYTVVPPPPSQPKVIGFRRVKC